VGNRALGWFFVVFGLPAFAYGLWTLPWNFLSVIYGAGLLAIGIAYLRGDPSGLGKQADGRFRGAKGWLGLGYRGMTEAVSRLRIVTSREDFWNEIEPDLFLGRIAAAHRLPPGVALVVDLTAELAEPASTRAGRDYRCLPTLDGCVPEDAPFLALALEVALRPGRTYVHCAVGHGRSATLVAAVLLARGRAATVDAAEAQMRQKRPRVGLSPSQKALLNRLLPQLQAADNSS
jgi:protein-tyrosine phosphatase